MNRIAVGPTPTRLLILFPLLAIGLGAQTSGTPTVSAVSQPDGRDAAIARLINRIDELESSEKSVRAELENLLSKRGTVTPAAPASPPAPIPVEPVDVPVPNVAEPSHTLGPVSFQGFSDFDYGRGWLENLPPGGLVGSPKSFGTGDFDLFTNTRISDHWSVMGEVLVTSDFTNQTTVELDRMLLTYKHNDYFQISFGKFNTALGYYTNAFGRAQYFQTAVGKPIMYSDEDSNGILPVHNIGITATGIIPSGVWGLHWVAEVANGTSLGNPNPNVEQVQNFADQNNGKAVNLAVYARPDWLHGFQTGFSTYRDTIHTFSINSIGQTILTAHIAYVSSRFEWLNEAAMVRHALEGTNRIYRSTTSYTQLSRAFGMNRPFVRYDYQNIPSADPIFGVLGRLSGPSFGINRRMSEYVFLKIQYERLGQRAGPSANGFDSQMAFTF